MYTLGSSLYIFITNSLYSRLRQFKPVLVKKDQDSGRKAKSAEVVTNGVGTNNNPDPVATESSPKATA